MRIFENDSGANNDEETETCPTLFISQLSVDLKYARLGFGRKLVHHVEFWAREQRFLAVDLTTFELVPFNKSYYERLGYRALRPDELEKPNARDLKLVLRAERSDEILGRWDCVAIRKMMI